MTRTAFKDYYALLGLAPEAGAEALANAWRRASFRWHPDRNPECRELAHRRFLELSEAFDVLSDPARRARFDLRYRRRQGPSRPRTPPRAAPEAGPVSFGATLARASAQRARRERATREGPAFEARVRKIMEELAAPLLEGQTPSWVRLLLLVLVFLLSLGASRGLFLLLAVDGGSHSAALGLMAILLPLLPALLSLRALLRAARDWRRLQTFRPDAERMAKRQHSEP